MRFRELVETAYRRNRTKRPARHCQLKQRWYAPAVGGAVVRCREVLGTPIGLSPSQPRGDRKLTSTPLSYNAEAGRDRPDCATQNKSVIYDLLFRTASETLLIIAADPKHLGARIGITAVLHSWGSAMTHHPHLHMIVPGGGISLDGTAFTRVAACTLAQSPWVTAIRGLQTFRPLHACPGCFRLERSPGGPCTHWKSAA